MMRGPDIQQLQQQRGWSRGRLILELRQAARRQDIGQLPSEDSLRRMIREWIAGDRGLSKLYADLLTDALGAPFATGRDAAGEPDDAGEELRARLDHARAVVDPGLVELLERHTDGLRTLDRQLGARELLAQTVAHVDQLTNLLTYALPGGTRPALAAAAAEAAALAGWQALDLGRPKQAWDLHETAKVAARDSGSAAVIAHVTAQQAYALLDVDKPADALALIRHAKGASNRGTPAVVQAWLWAAEAEALAAAGEVDGSRRALDQAAAFVGQAGDDSLPYLFLDETHLARWRGHCLARVGADEAVDQLAAALSVLDPSFTRAAASHHCDLALAYSQRGEHDAAKTHAELAARLAAQTSSARQRRRIARLKVSGSPGPAR
jgi:hypothetical protein